MATLTNKTPANTYKDLLKIATSTDNAGLTSSLQTIEDGNGTDSALQVSTAGVKSTGTLEVSGAATFSSSVTANELIVTTTSQTTGYKLNDGVYHHLLRNRGNTLDIIADTGASGGDIRLFTNGLNERMRIDSSGNVGIGTATPAYKLDVNGTGRFTDDIYLTKASPVIWYPRRIVINSNGDFGVNNNSNSVNLFNINNSGAATFSSSVTATSFITSSDARSKENIELANLQTCYDNVKNLKLKRFGFKKEIFSDEQMQDRNQIGFIAQEVEEIFPNAIHTRKLTYNQKFEDVVIPAKFDENGVETEPEKIEKKLISEDVIEDFRGLDKNQIEMALYGAVQHLIAKVEALEAK